ncbi:hypothetical protein TSAR_006587 [Trichomalopsis sarcophagae]|uniref:Uncharacterized protein n=1 Tax=Trichomalopsis sarcophagae TaxID=543379 RepID=A0A232EEW9_9HYME|nr:hypothetical protein TSAR_006587 [Trichomalopsis sarcophagae]
MNEARRKREELERRMEDKVKALEEKAEGEKREETEARNKGEEEKEDKDKQLNELEWRIEEGERERKRNNVVLTGLKEDRWDKVKRTWMIRGKATNRIGVECKDREEKEKIKAKSNLKGMDLFIDHDTTWLERRNKEKLNELVKEWRNQEKQVKVGKNKLTVGDEELIWGRRQE